MIYPGEGKKGQPKAGDYVLAAEQTRAEAAASPHRSTAFDLASADRWEAQARTKQLPSTRTEIGAGGELIDREDRWDELGVVNTVADPDYVTASASRERLELASEAGSLSFALDAAETIQARDSLEKMLVHQMAVLHRGMMRAAIRMNEEISRLNEHPSGFRPICRAQFDFRYDLHCASPSASASVRTAIDAAVGPLPTTGFQPLTGGCREKIANQCKLPHTSSTRLGHKLGCLTWLRLGAHAS